MSQILKQSTAFTFRLGPFLDSVDGNTQENALTIAYTDVLLSKAGGALTAKNDTTALTGTGANGHYTCVLNATDTGTLGALRVWCHVAGALAVWQDFVVIPANIYDSMVAGTDLLDVNIAQWLGTACATPTVAGVPEVDMTHIGGDAQSQADLKDFADTGYDPAAHGVLIAPVHRPANSSGTAQSGTISQITLEAGASAINDIYLGQKISIYEGTGNGQTRGIANYNGTTKVAAVARNWTVAPDATSKYRIEYDFGPKVNNNLQTYVNDNGADLSAIPDLDTLLSRLTAARAGYLDNLNGHVPQTGDSYAIVNHGTYGNAALNTKLGSPAVTLAADIASIKVDTGTTIINHLTGIKGATFDTATDSLEALRNRGDSAWTTAAGFSTHSAADVWAVGARALTDKAGFSLSAAGVDAILDEVVEGSSTLRQLIRIMAAVLAGKSAGGGTAEIIFTGIDGTTARVTATVDANGNRTAMTLNGA